MKISEMTRLDYEIMVRERELKETQENIDRYAALIQQSAQTGDPVDMVTRIPVYTENLRSAMIKMEVLTANMKGLQELKQEVES